MDDMISRQAAINAADAADYTGLSVEAVKKVTDEVVKALKNLPSAQPERIQNNAVHLCDSCQYTYVTCPSHGNDAVFGDGKGNDNICACNKYRPISAQPVDKDTNVPCTDTISRKAAIDAINDGAELLRRVLDDADVVGVERAKYEWGLGLIESYISDMKDLPSAQPEIIRCKDCIFHGFCRASTKWAVAPKDDWYCADAERRTYDLQ